MSPLNGGFAITLVVSTVLLWLVDQQLASKEPPPHFVCYICLHHGVRH